MIKFFEVISLSAPHIYHSALPLAPQTSIIHKLYKQYTRPLPRVVRGLPSSWDPTAVTSYSDITPYDAIWSPHDRVIAIVDKISVVILDAATLSQLYTFAITSKYLYNECWRPSFSPDGHCLTLIGRGELISWDLQTGGPLGVIPSGLERNAYTYAFSSTYSEDGKVVAAAYSASDFDAINRDTSNRSNTFIRTYDLSGTEAGPHCAPKGRIIPPIWTHEKCIRFVTINPGSVVVSEVEFTLKNPPVEVESLPISDKIVDGDRFVFLPTLSRLAFVLKDTIQVWDAKAAKLLLQSELPSKTYPAHLPIGFPFTNFPVGSFSSNGCFFAHVDKSGVVRVWKESPIGYLLHQKLPFVTNFPIEPRLSPSGESIFISPNHNAFHLWRTRDQVSSPPSISASNVDENSFTLAFSPDERLAAFAQQGGNVVTIFNLLTGDLQLAIDTDMGVVCLGMTGSTLVVVGEENIVTWDLPGGDCAFNASINDSIRTTTLHCNQRTPTRGSISPDFSRIAVLTGLNNQMLVEIYDISTGRCLTSTWTANQQWVGFTQDGCEVWTISRGWKIVEDSGSSPIQLMFQGGIVRPSGVFPWESHRGYEVTADGWVLSATQKRLLWLPHRWRSDVRSGMVWSGRFLGLLQRELSDIVILEFPE